MARGLQKQAKQYGKLQVGPEKRAVRAQKREAGRTRKRQLRSNRSMGLALQEAISAAISDTGRTSGLSERDLAIALGELARRRTDVASGAVLRRGGIEREFEESRAEARTQLQELKGEQGQAAATRLSELQEAARDRALEKRSIRLQERELAGQETMDAFERRMRRKEFRLEKGEAKEESGTEIRTTFNEALSKLRLTETPGGKKLTPAHARQHRGEIVDGVTAELTNGDRMLAQAVVSRYLNESPSARVQRYLRDSGAAGLGRAPRRRRSSSSSSGPIRPFGGRLSRGLRGIAD